MDGCIDGWLHAWMDGWKDGWMDDGRMDAWMHGYMDPWMDEWVDVCMDTIHFSLLSSLPVDSLRETMFLHSPPTIPSCCTFVYIVHFVMVNPFTSCIQYLDLISRLVVVYVFCLYTILNG